MIEIRKISKSDHNYSIFKDGIHVSAVVKHRDSGKWFMWKDPGFTKDEYNFIQKSINEFNKSTAGSTRTPFHSEKG